MSNDKKRIVYPIANFLENDLDKVLDIALIVAKFVSLPGPLLLCLELLIKHRKKIATAVGLVKKCAPDEAKTQSSVQPSQNEQPLSPEDSKRRFRDFVEVAKSNGVVSNDEREFLIPLGLKAGYSKKEIEAMLVIN
ncbi:MAG: hypothetical protein PUC77_02595 [Bacteroidales bacterium]|nr:hypothetical protein [Bacteroidales bacterium]MDD6621528.1 hypothetical protein [Bacteroidales bacterium]